MSTNTNEIATTTATTTAIDLMSLSFLKEAGVKIDLSAKSIKAARRALIDNGAVLAADKRSDLPYVVAAQALTHVGQAEASKRQAAIELAILDKSGVAMTMTSPNGKPYTSTRALFKDIFPSLSVKTLSNYLGVGRDVYVPALTGELTDDSKLNSSIAALPPSQALVLKGTLNSDKTKSAMVAALAAPDETITDKEGNHPAVVDTLSYAGAKQLVDKVKQSVDAPAKEANKATAVQDAKAAVDEEQQRLNAAFHLYLNVDSSNDEFIATTAEQYVLNFTAALKDAVKNGDAAIMAIKAIANAYGIRL